MTLFLSLILFVLHDVVLVFNLARPEVVVVFYIARPEVVVVFNLARPEVTVWLTGR